MFDRSDGVAKNEKFDRFGRSGVANVIYIVKFNEF